MSVSPSSSAIPPYDREQRGVGDAGKRKGGVVRYGADGVAPLLDSETAFRRVSAGRAVGAAGVAPLLDSVTEPMRAAGLGGHLKNVYNDYVYFWRWAVWQAIELPPGPGVVAFITAFVLSRRGVDGRSAPPSAERLRRTLDRGIWEARDGAPSRRRTSSTSRPRSPSEWESEWVRRPRAARSVTSESQATRPEKLVHLQRNQPRRCVRRSAR